MKYSLYKTLLNKNDILSHVFLNCAHSFLKEIAEENEGMSREEIEGREVDIELKINGKVCNPKDFFDVLYEQYELELKKEATNMVKRQTNEKFLDISNKVQELEDILETYADDIKWDFQNPYQNK